MLRIQSMSIDLAGHSVLRGVDLELEPGQTVAVVGRNGAGKTTLLRGIMGLVPPRSGRLLLDGEDITRSPASRRAAAGFGYAPEDRVILPTLSVAQNIALPCEVLRLPRHEIRRRIDALLASVPQIEPMLARSGAALSGGQGKIVALARALMVGVRFVLLDEPFQGLAPALARQYGDALRALRVSHPQLCVVVTESNAALLEAVQSRTLHIERGSITEAAGATDADEVSTWTQRRTHK
ncbi:MULTISPECIES: ATP-binding cassette domain-containing protein [unclassified Variovorax]|uniref:ABC transporter ATP-binding protein n=1 Tax=unclassified Variovorax TaxID=663243 RepID=UPI00076CE317|nr:MULTISPECIES: ATP-binding cassette domain-containing protein [unclassified Variovorax]KWT66082.1 Branched-chain amino acid transport ATP-binding protein LivF [Variovorax sp. WDL1]PNG55793.1 Lipopolysaccharide export system ATP-binding protein LptB [Variovorax sp. B4]PNG57217.1 Lipopolysaccharide export system ATP-binding protein LptB [Variovorax sp. B2]VTV10454.1 Lipopolysaccharide export system ATP-binding protein LptB [Variovorax sp. WDL1]